jgi:hypothetical protein
VIVDVLEPDPKILAHWLSESERPPARRMSANGRAWHSMTHHQSFPDLSGGAIEKAMAMLALSSGSPGAALRFEWWANVLFTGAAYRTHRHSGTWAFVHHLTDGATLHFPELGRSFPATAGQLIVFDAGYPHFTDPVTGPRRVSIAGNLWY